MHIENLGSQEGILQAKLEILAGLKAGGKLLLNGDDALLRTVREKGQLQPFYFGTASDCQVRAENVLETAEGIHYDVVSGNDRFGAYLALEGQHYVIDSLAAVAVGKALNISDENIQKGLAAFHTMAGRQEIFAVNGRTIISDCYNAGPESMAAALAVLGNRPGRHIAVLGDMLELGDHAPKAHEAVGAIAAQKAHVILAYGPDGEYVQKGATEAGMAEENALWFTDRDALAQYLKQISQPEDVLLFKGSRGMRMELILEKFLQQEN
jgi:UDP-N-acetylmuramoyl-tripeptide--D-alanyl-D-alanine ligase